MDLRDYYNRPKSWGGTSEEYDENGIGSGIVSRYHEDRVYSQVVCLEDLKHFTNKHYRYAHNYDYYMSEETFDLLCQSKYVNMNSILAPNELYMDGLHILPHASQLKIGEILAIPQHDFEHFEPMIYG